MLNVFYLNQATVEAVQELIKKHEEFSKRMDAQDEKINQMIQFAQRLANEGHYAQDKITEKAQSLHERYRVYQCLTIVIPLELT